MEYDKRQKNKNKNKRLGTVQWAVKCKCHQDLVTLFFKGSSKPSKIIDLKKPPPAAA